MNGTFEVFQETPQVIFVRLVGSLSVSDARTLAQMFINYADHAPGPIYAVGDLSAIQVMHPQSRVHLIEMMRRKTLYGAFYGAPLFAQLGVKAVALAAGAMDRIHFFPTEEAARDWVQERCAV